MISCQLYANHLHKSICYKAERSPERELICKMKRRSSYPSRQLNSERIKGATLCYLSPVIVGKCSVVSAKCFLSVEDGLQKSWNQVCHNRDICDKALSG